MKKVLYLTLVTLAFCQEAFDGLTIYSPTSGNGSGITYLVDNQMNIINSWTHPYGAASMPYLLKDSTLIYPYRVPNPTMNSGGVGGFQSILGMVNFCGVMKSQIIYTNIIMMLSLFLMEIFW